MSFKFNEQAPLEHNVQAYLTELTQSALRCPFDSKYISMFDLYTELNNALAKVPYDYTNLSRYYKSRSILAATFNKTIGDLKKVGIVAQSKEGLYLSDAAWQAASTGGTR